MKVNFAHIRERAQNGGWINFAVFDARSSSGSRDDNSQLLAQLTAKARVRTYASTKLPSPSCPADGCSSSEVRPWWISFLAVGSRAGPTPSTRNHTGD